METLFKAEPIGYIRSPVRDRLNAPRQGRDSGYEVMVEILPEYSAATEGIERWDTIQVICWMHLASRDVLQVHPKGNPSLPLTGVFATRSPARPNPLAVYTAELIGVENLTLKVSGIDAVNGTPVMDIKPHVHRLDD
ncbi:tRNA (N6-threonylcarbamoyladenosine(37)-N6)-methyltransferase TrmO [bacterium]|nr:MAG: tRNA (N6-threonylcarbamoyladenosine(37)-N6)-methyltransferase TrmO [bacterium]